MKKAFYKSASKFLLIFFSIFAIGFGQTFPELSAPSVCEQKSLTQEGFLGQTLVKTPGGYKPIEELKEGDEVVSLDESGLCSSKIKSVSRAKVSNFVLIDLGGQSVLTAAGQKFFVPETEGWTPASQLCLQSCLLAENPDLTQIKSLQLVRHPAEVFCISLECNHNFFITENDILVHNLGPFAIGITVAFGSGGVKFLGASIGAGIGCIFAKCAMSRYREQKREDLILSQPIPPNEPQIFINPRIEISQTPNLIDPIPKVSEVQLLITPIASVDREVFILQNRNTDKVDNMGDYFGNHPTGKAYAEQFENTLKRRGLSEQKKK